MLGDHLYRSNGPGLLRQRRLIEAYQRSGTSVVGLRRTPESQIASFGTATGVWLEPAAAARTSPSSPRSRPPDYARTNLRVPGFPEGEYLTIFGQYVHQAATVRPTSRSTSATTSASAASSSSRRPSTGCGRRTASTAWSWTAAASTSGCPSTTSTRCGNSGLDEGEGRWARGEGLGLDTSLHASKP